MSIYAKNTSVSVEKSEGEIKYLLIKYGADQFASAWSSDKALIRFRAQKRLIQFVLPLPNINDDNFVYKTRGGNILKYRKRDSDKAHKLWEQACRQKWRALALAIKAKLEAVASKITTFEEEFYAHIILPNGKTIFQETREGVKVAYESGKVTNLLEFNGGTMVDICWCGHNKNWHDKSDRVIPTNPMERLECTVTDCKCVSYKQTPFQSGR